MPNRARAEGPPWLNTAARDAPISWGHQCEAPSSVSLRPTRCEPWVWLLRAQLCRWMGLLGTTQGQGRHETPRAVGPLGSSTGLVLLVLPAVQVSPNRGQWGPSAHRVPRAQQCGWRAVSQALADGESCFPGVGREECKPSEVLCNYCRASCSVEPSPSRGRGSERVTHRPVPSCPRNAAR